ncbi:hypothetical protein GIB67_041081 [Kingdonia uniflora]|uniref:Import inner membrane translocase subunit n=1 Tax=Kingdonia uniflora TaxID=39325 RepID=A0A7J7LK57_9MAGN|nr:hypothetical protein GIB67_041081 [Kingdonia uniflora]
MARRIIQTLHQNPTPQNSTIFSYILSRTPPSSIPPTYSPSSFLNPSSSSSQINSILRFKSYGYGGVLSRSLHSYTHTPSLLNSKVSPSKILMGFISKPRNGGFRYFSIKGVDKFTGVFKEKVVEKPVTAVRSAFTRYRAAVGLQSEAFWKRNYLVVVGALGVGVCIMLWRIMFGIANTFVGLSEGMAKYGFLALSTALVTLAGLYVRSRYTINPDRVYRIAMRKLNTSAGILEVMGAPLSGTDLRAYVMSGGLITLKNFKLKFGGKRCFLIFPIRGSERKGLVSVEVKKKKGQYDMKLLAVDIPVTSGPDQRFFLIGNEEEYRIGGGLIAELRDPIVKAMAAEKEFEALDQMEEEEDEERELKEAERKHREEMNNLDGKGSP